ncbi:hypothetical protein V6N13_063769 [Hibiscus sabdariffa]|uniref:Uncharacterized protein n=1 Tax=Hibiscus sabdariffa TaxID=183260 RepID=A0ABR2R169_9ROSI
MMPHRVIDLEFLARTYRRGIIVSGKNLRGYNPSEHRNLIHNNFYGSIPDQLLNTTLLHNMFLYANNLSSSLLPSICKLPRLQNLDLSNNSPSGSLPENLKNYKQLQSCTGKAKFGDNNKGKLCSACSFACIIGYRNDDSEFKDNEKGERLGKPEGELVAIDKGFSFELDELLRASAYVLGKSRPRIVYIVVLGNGIPVVVR